MIRREFLSWVAGATAVVAAPVSSRSSVDGDGLGRAFPLKVAGNRRHLVDSEGRPFFVLGDTPWFLQRLPIDAVRRVMDDRRAKGFNTLFLEILDDSRIPSRDAQGEVAFQPETDITRPV